MRKIFRGGKFTPKSSTKDFRINERIFATELTVIDENGQNLGVLKKFDAIELARERELDLVEVSPKAIPPLAKIMDYGSFKYRKEKQERKAKSKQKNIEIKTIKLSPRIGQHDMDIRVAQGVKFLTSGDKVKIEMQLRGRENQHANLAFDNIKKTIAEIGQKLVAEKKEVKIEQPATKQGNRISAVIAINN